MRDADDEFWQRADRLVATHRLVIDRPAGSRHPRYPEVVYPFDYGYLEGTSAVDAGGVDAWRGSLAEATVTGVIATIDTHKRDAELKLLIGCTEDEMTSALVTHRTEWQDALLIRRSGPRA